MPELEQALIGESAHAAPSQILEGLSDATVHRALPGAPHTIYQELWHIAGRETPYPASPSDPFPNHSQTVRESWANLCAHFHKKAADAASIARNTTRLELPIRCTSRPGDPIRAMTVREQLESLAAHNAYHFGRIVLLRQLCGAWPPKSGGFTW